MRKLRRLYLPYVALGTLFVLLHNKFLEWHLIAYDFSTGEPILPYDTPELLRTLGRVFLFLHHEQMQTPFWFLQGLFLGLMLFFCITLATRKLAPTPAAAERLRGGCILFLFTAAMLLARHPSGIPASGSPSDIRHYRDNLPQENSSASSARGSRWTGALRHSA